MNNQVRPNLFLVGAPKCGTTSMHGYLAQHPLIFMSTLKEPRFWSDDLRAQGRVFHRNAYRRHLTSFRGLITLPRCVWKRRRTRPELSLGIERLDEYLSLFERADPAKHRYIGEASPDSMWSEHAAKRIATFNRQARIIIMLREPLSYIASMHREALAGELGEQVQSLERALELESERRRGNAVPCTVRYPFSVFYRLQAHFDVQVQRFLDTFERQQIHFVLLEDLDKATVRSVNDVFSFLGVPTIASDLDLRPRNVTTTSGALRELSPSWTRMLREEMTPVVSRLEQQTGMSLKIRWDYLN